MLFRSPLPVGDSVGYVKLQVRGGAGASGDLGSHCLSFGRSAFSLFLVVLYSQSRFGRLLSLGKTGTSPRFSARERAYRPYDRTQGNLNNSVSLCLCLSVCLSLSHTHTHTQFIALHIQSHTFPFPPFIQVPVLTTQPRSLIESTTVCVFPNRPCPVSR